jgi:aminobenzoyl-glutamate transport protein
MTPQETPTPSGTVETSHTPEASGRKARPHGFLGWIEWLGNKLPNPFWLFAILGGLVLVISWLGSLAGWSASDPQSGDPVEVTNLLTTDGLHQIVTGVVTNYTDFPPLGVIITVMLGVAVAEYAGLISALVRAMVAKTGPKTLTFAIALAGVTGSVASDAVYVIVIPLGAMAFHAIGRSPIVGAMVAFVASSGGFNSSLVLNITDVLLSGLSTSAAQIVDPDYVVNPLSNYFFVMVSAIMLSVIITLLTELFMNRRIHQLVDHDQVNYDEVAFTDEDGNEVTDLTLKDPEVRGLRITGLVSLVGLAVYFALLFVSGSPLQGEGGSVMDSPLITDIAVPIALGFFLLGTVYGVAVGSVTSASDIPEFMVRGLKTLLPMMVLFFAVSQFLAWFQWSNLGQFLSIKGSELLQTWDLPPVVLFTGFLVMVCLLNLMITSGSAQWALMAPVVVPMMMYVGISPEVTQMLFRIGDSTTNIITPMSPYFALAFSFLSRYYRKAGLGTLLSMSIPYSMAMLVGWFLFFLAWWALGIPLGPGAPMEYPAN